MRTVPPSAEIEEQIDRLLGVGVGENPRESLSELAKLGARLIIQRAVEHEFDAWLGRARYERRPDYQRAGPTAGVVRPASDTSAGRRPVFEPLLAVAFLGLVKGGSAQLRVGGVAFGTSTPSAGTPTRSRRHSVRAKGTLPLNRVLPMLRRQRRRYPDSLRRTPCPEGS